MYPAEFIAEMVEFCEKKNLWLIMDDIYNRLVFDGRRPRTPTTTPKQDVEQSKLVVVKGVSKMYAMTGFRIGWAIGNRELVGGDDQHPVAPDLGPGDGVAVGGGRRAHRRADRRSRRLRLTLENKRNVMVERLHAIPGVQVTKPDGTFYCFPDFSAYMKDSQKLAELLLEQGAGGDGAGQGVRHGRPPAPQLLRHDQGDHRGHRAHQVGARPATRPTSSILGDRKLVRDWP